MSTINYSTALRPNPMAIDEPKKAYATAQCKEVLNLNQFAEHITSHGSVYKRADIIAMTTMIVDCMKENLLDGKRITLGELGTFYISLESKGANSLAEFTADNITAVKVNWTPGVEFQDLRKEATFQLVPARKDTALVLSAHKSGETIVDLNPSDDTEEEEEGNE